MVKASHPASAGLSQASASESFEASAEKGEQKRPVYEVSFHVAAAVGEEGAAAAMDKVRSHLGSTEIISEQFPAKTHLAYTIEISHTGKREKHSDSYFGWIKFATEREAIPAIEEKVRGMKEIIRSLLIETAREEIVAAPRRAVFTSDRLEGETLKKPVAAPEKSAEVSEEELDKSIEALVSE